MIRFIVYLRRIFTKTNHTGLYLGEKECSRSHNFSFIVISIAILQFLPTVCLALISLLNVLSVFWEAYAKRSLGDDKVSQDIYGVFNNSVLHTLSIFTLYFFTDGSSFGSARIVSGQTVIFLLVIIVSLYLISSWKNYSDLGVSLSVISVQAILLLKLSNLIAIFFLLELLNSVILYTMLWSSIYDARGPKQSSARVTNSITYQFVLNFFSSILLYAGINSVIVITGSADLNYLAVYAIDPSVNTSFGIVLFAFLLKFGTGPWIFFKINVYRGLNLTSILLYSIIYLSLVFTFYLNLFMVFDLSFSSFSRIAAILVSVAAASIFGGFAFQTPNVFVFLSFSSLLNLSVFLLQLLVLAS